MARRDTERDARPGLRSSLSLGTKLAVVTVAVLCVVSTVLYFEITRRERWHLVASKVTAANMVSDLFAASLTAPLDFGDKDAVDTCFSNLKSNGEITYAAVWAPSGPRPLAEEGRADPSRIVPSEVAAGGVNVLEDRLEIWRTVTGHEATLIGRVLLVFSLASENAAFQASRTRIFWWSLFMTAATAMLLIAVTRHQIIAPLGKLADGARRLERGELGSPVDIASGDEIGGLAKAFNAMGAAIADREESLEAARRNLRELFDHMRQAILAFGPGGNLEGEASQQAVDLFGYSSFEGHNIETLLYPDAPQHDVDLQAFREWVSAAVDAPEAVWGELAGLAPTEVELQRPGRGPLPLELEFQPLMRAGRVARIMLLATDVTENRKLERTVQSQEEHHARQMAAMRRMVSGGAHIFVGFLENSRQRLVRAREIVLASDVVLRSAEMDELFRHVHTIKGEAKAFDLRELEEKTAKLEVVLDELRGLARGEGFASSSSLQQQLSAELTGIGVALDNGRDLFVAAAPAGRATLDQITVQRADVHELLALVGDRDDRLADVARRLAFRPFGDATANLVDMAPTWADKEGKRARMHIEGKEVRVSPALSRVMNGVLVHLVRNCIAHGIELPARRRALGKEETGLIQIVATVGASGPVIVVEDDGGGLDQRRIAERARLLGLDESVAASELVFSSGLSTADAGGDLAGRGVGLSAARAELADVGYSIEVESGDGEFTRFVIHPNLDDA